MFFNLSNYHNKKMEPRGVEPLTFPITIGTFFQLNYGGVMNRMVYSSVYLKKSGLILRTIGSADGIPPTPFPPSSS
jgi:hypothetical protein